MLVCLLVSEIVINGAFSAERDFVLNLPMAYFKIGLSFKTFATLLANFLWRENLEIIS